MTVYKNYKLLRIRVNSGVANCTIDNPPVNLITIDLVAELMRFTYQVERDDNVKVIVFKSADPDIFLAHFDVSVLSELPDEAPPKSTELHEMNKMGEAYRTMPKVSIGMIEGIARGGGSEFLLALDMRFGAIGKAILGQPEVLVGIIPGGGGTQRLPRLMGSSRALEVVLSGGDVDAELAERYGYINRALPPKELKKFVRNLALRIASLPAETIALAKKAVLAAVELPIVEGLLEETNLFNQACALPEAKQRMKFALKMDAQSREAELGKR